jgi:outer membrane lipoprotein-sorting protein
MSEIHRFQRVTVRLALLVAASLAIAGATTPTLAQSELSAEEALDLVRSAWENFRGQSSVGEITMTIHRPDWERSMSMQAWTRGTDNSLVRVTEPRKDAGSGTLMVDDQMWTYAPKINRVIKVPSSMMAQSWMGSDFSNKDVSRADDIVDQYSHRLVGEESHDGHRLYVIESTPHEDAAVVWGKEMLRIRDDGVLISEEFYDQDGVLVKAMVALEVGEMGGRTLATRQRMAKADTEGEWTEISFDSLSFDVELEDSVFTLSNLRNPRR